MRRYRLQVANAGVNEIGDYFTPKVKNGQPQKPTTATVDVNLLGSIYSESDPIGYTCNVISSTTALAAHLAVYFLEFERKPDDALKAIILIGSMGRFLGCFRQLNVVSDAYTASWQAAANSPIYSATKSGVLALGRSLAYPLAQKKIRVAVIHPFFTGP